MQDQLSYICTHYTHKTVTVKNTVGPNIMNCSHNSMQKAHKHFNNTSAQITVLK